MYDRDIRGEDLSRRFDYLFESLDVDESAGNGDDVTHQVPEQPDDDSRWSRRIVLTGIGGALDFDADPDRSTCSGHTAHGQCTCRPYIGGGTNRRATTPTCAEADYRCERACARTDAAPATTRAPISVSPESRPPFPDQNPPRNNDQRGGLLGGLFS